MADARRARREAEKAARDALSGTLVGVAGDLGAAAAGQQDAAVTVDVARAKAATIVEAARREAAAVIAFAEHEEAAAAQTYAAAWSAARDAGWTPAQLRSMGYGKPPTSRKAAIRPSATGTGNTETAASEPAEPVAIA